MPTFSSKQSPAPQPASAELMPSPSVKAHTGVRRAFASAKYPDGHDRSVGADPAGYEATSNRTKPRVHEASKAGLREGWNFTRIPVHTRAVPRLQAKLAINEPGDEYEQEADRVAEHVMRMPLAAGNMPMPTKTEPGLQRMCTCGGSCDDCTKNHGSHEHSLLQRAQSRGSTVAPGEAPPIVHEVLRSPGQPLDTATRAFMEPRFGQDFSHVRVHSNAAAQQSAREINARAYTAGQNIVLGVGNPTANLPLFAHELAHVIQQSSGPAGRTVQRAPAANPDPKQDRNKAERDAHAVVGRIKRHGKVSGEVRALIKRHLGYYEGPARQAYIDIVKVVLKDSPDTDIQADTGAVTVSAPDNTPAVAKGQKGEKGDKGEKGEKGEPGVPGRSIDPLYLLKFESTYNEAVGTWAFISQKQEAAIRGVYTEAQKTKPPNILDDLLISLAVASLGFGIGAIAGTLASAVEKRLDAAFIKQYAADAEKQLQQLIQENEGWVLDEEIRKQLAEQLSLRKTAISAIAKGTGDGFKDGVKSLIGDKVKNLLKEGKKSVDAFFEGQIDAIIEANAKNFWKSEESRTDLFKLSLIHPLAPIIAATALRDGMKEHFAEAEAIQKRATIVHWLSYQAQLKTRSETVQTPDGQEVPTTILHNVVKRGHYLGGGSERAEDFNGVVLVHAHVEDLDGGRSTVFADRGQLAGLSQAMLTPLEDLAIYQLRLPVVFLIHYHLRNSHDFRVGVNEVGKWWISTLDKWDRAVVEKIGGVPKIYSQLGAYSLKNLGVRPDR